MKQVIRRHVAVLLVIFLVSTVWAQQAKYVFYFIIMIMIGDVKLLMETKPL